MTTTDSDYRGRLATEAARIRDSGILGRSEPLIRLFDFLLERSLAGRTPREIEIAQEVFDKTSDFDVMLDASVRVYIHRLRRKISEYYVRSGGDSERISIPLGEYRMVLTSPQVAEDVPQQDDGEVVAPAAILKVDRFGLILVALLLVNLIAWAFFVAQPSHDAGPVQSNLWRPLFENKRPTQVVMGDYYVFGEAKDGIVVSRLVRDFSINSREELDAHLLANPEEVGRYVDVDLHYLPVSTGLALRSILPTVNAAARDIGGQPPVEAMSDVKPEIFKVANIVYIGFLSGLSALQDPLFRASGFRIGEDFDELVDKASGRRFKSDWGVVADGKVPQRDYGYIASLPGPGGNRIVIIAGTRDPAVVQMAEIAVDQQQLDAIDAKSGDGAFEALFEVRTLGNLNLGSSLVLARPIHAGSSWQPAIGVPAQSGRAARN